MVNQAAFCSSLSELGNRRLGKRRGAAVLPLQTMPGTQQK